MTNKEFYTLVIKANISTEITDKAKHLLEVANGSTSKRAEQTTENQKANLKLFNTIAEFMSPNTTYAASEIKALLSDTEHKDISTSKISAVFKVAIANELATVVSGYKVGGKGRAVNGYRLVEVVEDEMTEDETESE